MFLPCYSWCQLVVWQLLCHVLSKEAIHCGWMLLDLSYKIIWWMCFVFTILIWLFTSFSIMVINPQKDCIVFPHGISITFYIRWKNRFMYKYLLLALPHTSLCTYSFHQVCYHISRDSLSNLNRFEPNLLCYKYRLIQTWTTILTHTLFKLGIFFTPKQAKEASKPLETCGKTIDWWCTGACRSQKQLLLADLSLVGFMAGLMLAAGFPIYIL